MLSDVIAAADKNHQQSIANLMEMLRIPSISTAPQRAGDVRRCAEWIAAKAFLQIDRRVRGEDPQHAGTSDRAREKMRTSQGGQRVLFYGHYDVQPPEPLEKWTTPPFEPAIRKTDAGTDAIYARGAVDDKGQVWAHIEAISHWQKFGGVPVNLTMLIEGEEEIGSDNLEDFIKTQAHELKADIAVISDTGQFDRGIPAITYGLRGLAYCEVILTGPSHDLHSGSYGGARPQPRQRALRTARHASRQGRPRQCSGLLR